jgi:hypothetical protein
MALGSSLPLTEISTRSSRGGKGRPVPKADNITAVYEPIGTDCLENVGASTSQNSMGLHGLLHG